MARFITFEGLDGSGKSTHLKHAEEWLVARGVQVCRTKEPGGTPVGEALRGIFLDPRWGALDGRVEGMMVFASRRQHLLQVIDPCLAAGTHVLCDRFTDSTLAYQGSGRGLDHSWIHTLDGLATGGRRPDFTLLFDLPATMAHGRGQSKKRRDRGDADRIDVEGLEFYSRVRESYLAMTRCEPERFRVIDSSGEKENTWRQVTSALGEIFASQLVAEPES